MHAFVEHLHGEIAAGQAAQRGGAPQLVVVGAARIQADHQRRLADAVGEVVDIGWQVVAARLFTGFDQHHAAGVRQALGLQRQHGGQRAEDGVAVIGAAAAIQLVAAQDRGPRAEVVVPAGHFRLLVQVAVEQDGVVAGLGAGGRNFQEDQRGTAFQAHHFNLQAGQLLGPGPVLHQRDRLFHVAVLHPIGVEHRRLVGNADVVDQLRDDLAVPLVIDELAELGAVHLKLRLHGLIRPFYACATGRVFPTSRRVFGWLTEIRETDRLCACGDGHCSYRRDCRSGRPESQGDTRCALVCRVEGTGAGHGDRWGACRRTDRHQPRRCPGAAAGIDDGRSRQGRGDRRAPAQTRPVSSRRGPDAGEGDRESNRRTESTADHRRQQVVAGGSGTRIGTGANRTEALTAGIVGTGRKLVQRSRTGRP